MHSTFHVQSSKHDARPHQQRLHHPAYNCFNRLAVFQCETCSNETIVACDRGRIDEPAVCSGCAGKFTMKLLHNRCGFMNKQLIKMQVGSRTFHC